MSELTTAARPYAKAVFEVANAAGELDKWSAQLDAMAAIVSSEGSAELLSNPKITATQKVEVISDVAKDVMDDAGTNLLNTLAENDRFVLLPEISVLFEELKAEAEGAIEAEVISAQEIDDAQMANIKAALEKRLGREVKLVTSIDESLMGGAVIRAGDLVIDGSIQSRLKAMQTTLSR